MNIPVTTPLLLALFLASSTLHAANTLFDDPVLARGQGVEVKLSQLEEAFTAYRANQVARGQGVREEQRATREAQLLDRLITTQLLVNRATDADKARAKEIAEQFTAESKKGASSDEAFFRQLKAMGLSAEQFNRRVVEQALAEAVIERELRSKITVADAQIEEFHKNGTDALVKIMQDELERLAKSPDSSATQLAAVKEQIDQLRRNNLSKLEKPEQVRVAHIFLATRNRDTEQALPEEQLKAKRELIYKLARRARTGDDFKKLVLEFSEDQGLKQTGGEYVLSRNDPFTPEFKAAAFSLATNQVSDVVTTRFGFHVIKLLEKIPAHKVDLAKVASEIKEHLVQQAVQHQMPAYFARLKREAAVEVLDPKYRLSSPAEPAKPQS